MVFVARLFMGGDFLWSNYLFSIRNGVPRMSGF
jgi:hypothetical protein